MEQVGCWRVDETRSNHAWQDGKQCIVTGRIEAADGFRIASAVSAGQRVAGNDANSYHRSLPWDELAYHQTVQRCVEQAMALWHACGADDRDQCAGDGIMIR